MPPPTIHQPPSIAMPSMAHHCACVCPPPGHLEVWSDLDIVWSPWTSSVATPRSSPVKVVNRKLSISKFLWEFLRSGQHHHGKHPINDWRYARHLPHAWRRTSQMGKRHLCQDEVFHWDLCRHHSVVGCGVPCGKEVRRTVSAGASDGCCVGRGEGTARGDDPPREASVSILC